MIDQITNRLKAALARGIIHLVNDEAGRQQCQISVLNGEIKDKVERVQQYGFTSHPPEGTSCIVIFVGADRSKPVIIADNAVQLRFLNLNPGESAQHDHIGQYIHFKDSGEIEIKTNGLLTIKSADKVRIETDLLEVTGEIKDRCDSDGMTMSGMREVYNDHVHPENDGGGPTDEPNQMMEGGA